MEDNLKISRAVLCSSPLRLASSLILERNAAAQAGPVLESDANAQALGYKTDASRSIRRSIRTINLDKPVRVASFSRERPAMQWLLARSLGGKQVNAKGWCSAYVKKSVNRSN